MHCFDATLLIDYGDDLPAAVEKVRELRDRGERLTTPSVAVAELLVGAYRDGGRSLAGALAFVETLEVLPVDLTIADEAGRMGAESHRRGAPLPGNDLLIAATARHHRGVLVSRDRIFQGVPGLALESY